MTFLELLLTAGYWPASRASSLLGYVSSKCPRCGFHTEDAFHLLWSCPHNRTIRAHAVSATQDLVPQARDGHGQNPAFWLRGMVPLDLVPVSTPYPASTDILFVGRYVPMHAWPEGIYHTDCSGGEHASFPALRRCGLGIAYLHQHRTFHGITPNQEQMSDILNFGVIASLPGSKQ